MKTFTQLTYEERVQIESLKTQKYSVRRIAQVLGRSPNTVSRELRTRTVHGLYIPKKAQHKAYYKRYLCKRDCMKVAMDGKMSQLVKKKLEEGLSPERIAGYFNLNGYKISTKAVYKYVYSRALDSHLFWRKYKKKSGWKKYRKSIQTRRNFIESRPVCTGTGHLEADFIVSSHSTWCLLVVVDRHTRYVWIEKIPNRKHAVVTRAFKRIIGNMSVQTITTDNDIAFSGWRQLEKVLHAKIYFCHPYHSWEKGLVENTNRWIRCWIPKRRDMGTVSEKELCEIQTFLNTVPRKCLGFRSASELQLEVKETEVS
ncbi:MAG: IS30 family transposase [Nitrospira sp.]